VRHLLNTPLGRIAETQLDLAKIGSNTSSMTDEYMDRHPLMDSGFATFDSMTGEFNRMDDRVFATAITTLFKSRPAARLWDIKPACPYREVPFLIESRELFSLTMSDKAKTLAEEWIRRPRMAGFRLEILGLSEDRSNPRPGKVSIYLYETEDDLQDTIIPLESIHTRYRSNW